MILSGGLFYQLGKRSEADFFCRPRPSSALFGSRLTTLVLLLGSFLYGSMMEEITRWLIFAIWIMAAGVWLPNILQVIWWRFNSWGYLSSWIANLGLSWLVVWIPAASGKASDRVNIR